MDRSPPSTSACPTVLQRYNPRLVSFLPPSIVYYLNHAKINRISWFLSVNIQLFFNLYIHASQFRDSLLLSKCARQSQVRHTQKKLPLLFPFLPPFLNSTLVSLTLWNYIYICSSVCLSLSLSSPNFNLKRSSSRSIQSSFMASSLTLLLVSLVTFPCFVSVSLSETLLLTLTHSLSHARPQFNSTHHLLRATSARSAARFRRYRRLPRQVSLPLSPGSDYTLSLTVHSQPVSLYMDTGSDLVWVPCSPFTCILCDGEPKPAPVAVNSSSASDVHCKSSACRAVHSSLSSSSDLCAMARCPLEEIEISDCAAFSCPQFYYAYGDGSLVGRLKKGVVTMPNSSPPLALRNFTFGCAHTALAEPVGVAGFGRGVLSLPAQLAASSPQLGAQFSYCLVPHSFDPDRVRRPSPLILGRYDVKETSSDENGGSDFVYTPMLDSPSSPYFYSIGLEGISVGRKFIPAPENLRRIDGRGDGGVVVDSGTTFTILPSALFGSVAAEFDRQLWRVNSRRAREVEEKTGLSPCYHVDAGPKVPDVALRFAGGSVVAMPRGNYFYEFVDGGDKGRRVGCLMMIDGGDEREMGGGPGATLGNYQQQGFEVAYDLEGRRVGFARRQCGSLWDSLRQR